MRGVFAIAAALAAGQHGRVTRRQLLAGGIDAKRIGRWIADGRLQRVHYGVYAVGHVAPSMHGDYIAAVLAGGAGAKLSCAPAVHVFRLTRARRPPAPEITVPALHHRRRPGIVIHRVKALHPHDVTSRTRSSSCSPGTACPAPRRTSTATATRSTATGRSTTSRSSCSPTASTPRDGFERDVARRRRSQHTAFTWGDVVERPTATIAELRQLLSRARSSATRLEPRA